MRTFNLTIKLGNDAMQTYADISGALATFVESYNYEQATPGVTDFGPIYDDNGNRVGQWAVSEPESAEAIGH